MLTIAEPTQTSAAVVVDTAPLKAVAEMVRAGDYTVVLVVDAKQNVLGLVRSDAVLRLAVRLADAPVRLLPLQKVITVKAGITAFEAKVLLQDEDVNALLIEKPLMRGWTVLTREEVLG